MAIYLVDEPFLDIAMAYSTLDKNARIVLLQDAVYSAVGSKLEGEVYVAEDDVCSRGLKSKISPWVHIISYSDLVQMMEGEEVINFL